MADTRQARSRPRRTPALCFGLILFATGLALAPFASAGVIYTAFAQTSDGAPTSAITPGSEILIDVTVRTDDFAIFVAASANGYDNTLIRFRREFSAAPIFGARDEPTDSYYGAIYNQWSGALPVAERPFGPGVEVEFLAALGLAPAQGDGSQDPGVITGVPGDPQFRLVFEWIGTAGTTTIDIGSFAEYGDGYLGTVDDRTTNTRILLTAIPEPTTPLLLGLGLVGLARVPSPRRERSE